MNCPTCGAPNVILHKDIWECGWCGDSGFIPQRIQDARRAAKAVRMPREITLTFTVEPGENEDTPEQPIFFDSAVERIVEQFPELKDEYESEALSGMMGAQLLEEVYRTDPQKAIAMWRSLPEKQEPLRDSHRAENFFCLLDFLWEHEDYNEDVLAPLLDAVRKDDTLAEMVFRSNYVCTLHLYLIQASLEQGKAELAEYLYALLQSNPLPREEWSEDPDEFDSLMEEYVNADDSTPAYRYCFVRVDNGRCYAYLTAGLPVKRGDLVRVPYGKKNEPKEGVVRSVGDYTRDTAPWPPEKTKRVLEILPKPQEPVKKEPAVPKPQQGEKETVKLEIPPVTEERILSSDVDTAPAAEAPQEDTPPKKRKFIPIFIVVAVVLVVVVGGVLLSRHSQAKRLAAWEQQYQTAAELFAGGNYEKAVELAEGVPESIAEQPALLTVAKAGVALNTNTEDSLRGGIDLLKSAGDLGSFRKQGNDLLTDMTLQLHASSYHKAVVRLRQYEPYIARPYLEELGNYKDAPTLLVYAEALSLAQQFNAASYKQALALLQTIPADYDGELAAEIVDLRDDLPDMIAEREEFEAQLAAYQAQQQQQKPKPPQTFNYGGSSTDTGPGSGHSLREDYGDPEDLYEDGNYDDLDEAWDEWEEGW